MSFTFPYWYDLHAHFRQDEILTATVKAHIDMGCEGILAMPNTKPPITRVSGANTSDYWTIESYRAMLEAAANGALSTIIVPLYLTKETTPDMIIKGAKSGRLVSCKYYPPHGTTNSEFGAPFDDYLQNGVFEAMSEAGVILNIHGEQHGLSGEDYFGENSNAEDYFYTEKMPRLIEKYPNLKVVCEHITTKTAADFASNAPDTVAATITPQHLLYTVADLLQGLKYHLYCLPLVKFEKDRQALLSAAHHINNNKFFAGTDSAPHTHKATACGCAAGCFTGLIAPQLYAQGFDLNESNRDAFEKFLCRNGANFYNLPISDKKLTLTKQPQKVAPVTAGDQELTLLHTGMGQDALNWSLSLEG